MAFRFKRNESVPEAAKRIAREELKSTVDQIAKSRGRNRHEAIHEARKSVKRVRALLAAAAVRIGRCLQQLRDAGAVVEIFDQLREKFRGEFKGSKPETIRRGLVARKKQAEEEADIADVLHGISRTLRTAAKCVKIWPIRTHGFPAIALGFESTFRQGRRAFARARKHPDPDHYHEWRKRVKDHWYHVRLLENLWADIMLGYENSLKDLEGWLGDDHNLALLRERLLAEPAAYGKEKDIDVCLRLISKHQKELRGNALSIGKRIYQEKPKHLTHRMKQLWDDWKREPD